jgi:hypothetical protein
MKKQFAATGLIFMISLLSARTKDEWPCHSLSTPFLGMKSWLPGEVNSYYRATRFVRCSLLGDIRAGCVSFYVPHYEGVHDPEKSDAVCGPAEEFDLATPPPGYEDSESGEFLKIGVGVLKRPPEEEEYLFYGDYELVDPGKWHIEKCSESEIVYRHNVMLPDGSYGVEYTHRVKLDKKQAKFRIVRTLKNIGRKTLTTRHYNHQFIQIGDAGIGPGYSLELSFEPVFTKPLADPEALKIDGKVIKCAAPFTDILWSPVTGFNGRAGEDNCLSVSNSIGKLSVSTDMPISAFALYTTPRVICPESFVDIKVEPNASKTWTTEFIFDIYINN